MHKPSPSRLATISKIATAIGILSAADLSPAFILNEARGRAPKGQRWISSSVYIPAGPRQNVEPTAVRNPKVAAQMNAMFDKWNNARIARDELLTARAELA